MRDRRIVAQEEASEKVFSELVDGFIAISGENDDGTSIETCKDLVWSFNTMIRRESFFAWQFSRDFEGISRIIGCKYVCIYYIR